MKVTTEQLQSLLGMVATAESDASDCDSCYAQLAEFAEAKLSGKPIPEALKEVAKHIEQCACCRFELDALMEGLRELGEETQS